MRNQFRVAEIKPQNHQASSRLHPQHLASPKEQTGHAARATTRNQDYPSKQHQPKVSTKPIQTFSDGPRLGINQISQWNTLISRTNAQFQSTVSKHHPTRPRGPSVRFRNQSIILLYLTTWRKVAISSCHRSRWILIGCLMNIYEINLSDLCFLDFYCTISVFFRRTRNFSRLKTPTSVATLMCFRLIKIGTRGIGERVIGMFVIVFAWMFREMSSSGVLIIYRKTLEIFLNENVKDSIKFPNFHKISMRVFLPQLFFPISCATREIWKHCNIELKHWQRCLSV